MPEIVFQASSTPTIIVNFVDTNGRPEDISGASRKRIVIRNESNAEAVKTLSLVTDGKDGKAYVTLAKADIKQPGVYTAQVDAAFGTWDGPYPEFTFTVRPNLSKTLG